MPTPNLVLDRRVLEAKTGPSSGELWALDVQSGEEKRVLAAPVVAGGFYEYTSPAGRELAVLAGEKGRLAVHLVTLADLSVRPLQVEGGPPHISAARWRSDGELMLAEYSNGPSEDDGGPETLTLWTCRLDDPRPTRLYQRTGPVVRCDAPRGARLALVATGPTYETMEQYELVDLASGTARPLDLPGCPEWWQVHWVRGGAGLVYAHHEGGRTALFTVDAATGRVNRPYECEGKLWSEAASADGRYAAGLVDRRHCVKVRIIDLATGRATTLRQWLPRFGVGMGPLWSPAAPVVAVPRCESFQGPATLRFFQLPAEE